MRFFFFFKGCDLMRTKLIGISTSQYEQKAEKGVTSTPVLVSNKSANYETDVETKSVVIHNVVGVSSPFAVTVINPDNGNLVKSVTTTLGVRSGISLSKSGDIYFCTTGANGLFS